jgi:hypothetical protein
MRRGSMDMCRFRHTHRVVLGLNPQARPFGVPVIGIDR